MNIPWKLKSSIFKAVDVLNVPSFLYFLQKNVTKRSRVTQTEISEDWIKHKEVIERFNTKRYLFEFGAGKSLAQNLYLSSCVEKQLLVDLNPMLDLELVEMARLHLSTQVELRSSTEIKELNDLNAYGIEYKAPYDATKLTMQEEQLDICISTNTLEHIPADVIKRIFSGLHRVLRGDGIVSAIIDYSDHYAHTDRSISLLNYLKFTEEQWTRYNHNCHYQNRLRHYDYIHIFERCGFDVVHEDISYGEERIPKELLDAYAEADSRWCATAAHIVLKKEDTKG